jgi:hypothetical protein
MRTKSSLAFIKKEADERRMKNENGMTTVIAAG